MLLAAKPGNRLEEGNWEGGLGKDGQGKPLQRRQSNEKKSGRELRGKVNVRNWWDRTWRGPGEKLRCLFPLRGVVPRGGGVRSASIAVVRQPGLGSAFIYPLFTR